MKKIVTFLFVIAFILTSFLIYNHKQEPKLEDVFNSTKNWSPRTEEVYFVKEIDGKWLTVFRNTHSVFIGELEQNWLGLWEVKESLASSHYPPGNNEEIIWGASDKGKGKGYYFGQIMSPRIQGITIETKENIYKDVNIISSNGKRFFFKEEAMVKGEQLAFPNIKGLSESGEVIFKTIRQ